MNERPDTQAHHVILDSIADGVFTVDEEWRITSFNRAAEQITGVAREEAIGRRCCDVFRASICESECALKETIHADRPIVNKAIYNPQCRWSTYPRQHLSRGVEGRTRYADRRRRDLPRPQRGRGTPQGTGKVATPSRTSSVAARSCSGCLNYSSTADSDSTVLIEGASGTGKELFARAIHNLSRRRDKRFVAINCGALPDTLLESELFGYKAGAFTDARRDKPGRLAVADGGTILLDEIGDISPAMQSRLLRVLQERMFEPLGSVDPVEVDVRVIAATHKDLRKLVKKGTFREDLFYRIHVIRMELPMLRDRREDIPLLIDRFVAKFNRIQTKDVAGVSDTAMALLMEYDYPGNVRELENTIEHAFVLCRGGMIEPHHLPVAVRGVALTTTRSPAESLTLRAWEAIHITDALRRHDGHRAAAARELGIDPSTLFRKIKSLDLHTTDPENAG